MNTRRLVTGTAYLCFVAAVVGCTNDLGPGEGDVEESSASLVDEAARSPAADAPLPVPPGSRNVRKPSGCDANLKVLPWAGFRSAATYTFDDSQPSQIDYSDEITATGARVTYFLTTVNNWYPGYDDAFRQALARRNELGNHTVNHCYFDLNCPFGSPLATVDAEIDVATDYIKTNLGAPDVYTMAYPFGDDAYRSSAQARFFLGRIAGSGATGDMVGPGDDTDPFLLPVIAAAGGEPAEKFSGDIDRAGAEGKWVTFLFHTILPHDQNWFAGVEIGAITGSIAHAHSRGDVWVDTFANVGAYWLGQKIVQAVVPSSARGKTTWRWTLPQHFPPRRLLRVTVDGGTLTQNGRKLRWDPHGYYEVALDAGSLTWSR